MPSDEPAIPLILIAGLDSRYSAVVQQSFAASRDTCRLELVESLADARTFIEKRTPSLICSEIRLPDGTVSELLHAALDICPVIILTGQGSEQLAVELLKAGVQDYLVTTPEAILRLPETVRSTLDSWHQKREQRTKNAAILRGKQEWEKTFDALPDLIAIIDTRHTITRVNRAMADYCGFRPDELIGRPCYEVMHGMTAPDANCPHVKMLKDGQVQVSEVNEELLKGIFEISVSPLNDPDGKLVGCVHVAHNITERKRAEQERRELDIQIRHTQKLESIGVLAGGIAHDFNNILTVVLGNCHKIREVVVSNPSASAPIVQIEYAVNRAAELCRQLLSYAGRNPITQTEIHLPQLVEEMSSMLRAAISKQVVLDLDLAWDLPTFLGDSSQIQQIIMNLIINAAEAIGEDCGNISFALKSVEIDDQKPETDFFGSQIPVGWYACLVVIDTGCGMDAETCRRIFEPFYSTKGSGRGLGMSVMLGIINSHHGFFQLNSSPGKGTTITVYLPLARELPAASVSPPSVVSIAELSEITILLVYDNDTLRSISTMLFSAMGYSVLSASSGQEAIDLIRAPDFSIDLVMLDLSMSANAGLECFRAVRELKPEVPVFIMCDYTSDELVDMLENDPLAEAVQKPYRTDLVRDRISKILVAAGGSASHDLEKY